MARPGCLLEQMFNQIATPEQKRVLRESFYNRNNFGGASTYITRIMAPFWFEKMESRKNKAEDLHLGVSTTHQAKDFDLPRISFGISA